MLIQRMLYLEDWLINVYLRGTVLGGRVIISDPHMYTRLKFLRITRTSLMK